MDRARFAFVLSIAWGAAILAGIIAVYLTIVGPANAAPPSEPFRCGEWEKIKAEFAKAGFYKAAFGMNSESTVLVILENEGGVEWVMFSVGVNGSACLIGNGANWTPILPPEPPVPGRRPA